MGNDLKNNAFPVFHYLIAISEKVAFNEDIDAPSIQKTYHDLKDVTDKVHKSPLIRIPAILSNNVGHQIIK